jgi:hypothetical protein
MDFPITIDKIRAYEDDIASQIEESIYHRIKPYMKINLSQIISELKDQVQKNIRSRHHYSVYTVTIGNYETLLRDFTMEDIEYTIKKRFADCLLRSYFPDAELKFVDRNYTIILEWNATRQVA